VAALADVVAKHPESGRRVRQRFGAVFDDAQFLAEVKRGQERGRLRALGYRVLRFARWDEIDLERELWAIPAARMKDKQECLVPLSWRLRPKAREVRVDSRGSNLKGETEPSDYVRFAAGRLRGSMPVPVDWVEMGAVSAWPRAVRFAMSSGRRYHGRPRCTV
jgi:hypothetical protein